MATATTTDFNSIHERALRLATQMPLITIAHVAFSGWLLVSHSAGSYWYGILAGIVTLTCVEYCLHRFLFHSRDPKSLLAAVHRRHHRNPSHGPHGIVPIPMSFLIVYTFSMLWFIPTQTASWAGFALGMSLAYIAHEWTHFLAHTARGNKSGIARFMQRYHLVHHFDDSKRNFGFVVPFWDMALGTYRAIDATEEARLLKRQDDADAVLARRLATTSR
ncbi:MAG: sterol desaturase family protein [Sandaracinaceae bacterium]|nr:sterol desaturase family protein [Sandaracinaceae bacterium]